jgi:hypothetical protein
VWKVRQVSDSKDVFFENLAARYKGFVPEKDELLKPVADYLFENKEVDWEAFKEWSRKLVNLDERVKAEAKYAYNEQKIWDVNSAT